MGTRERIPMTTEPRIGQRARIWGAPLRNEPGGLDIIATWTGLGWEPEEGAVRAEQLASVTHWMPLDD